MGRLAHDEGRRANAHANEERKRVLPDGIVPSDANLLVELVDNETSDVVVGFSELFTIWSCEDHLVALVHLERPALQKSNHHRKRNPNHQVTEHLKREAEPSLRLPSGQSLTGNPDSQ